MLGSQTDMPLYALMLRDEAIDMDTLPPDEQAALFQKFVDWAADLERRDKFRGVERLIRDGGNVVRRREGRIAVDGPYTEGKETILGFFLVEAADRAEAERLAAEAPNLEIGGCVEIREVGDFPKPAPTR
jgi:hypothetical protein